MKTHLLKITFVLVVIFFILFSVTTVFIVKETEFHSPVPIYALSIDFSPSPTMTPFPTKARVTGKTATPFPIGTQAVENPTLNLGIDLSNWKLTLPVGDSESPTEINYPELGKYKNDPWFVPGYQGGIRFRAPVSASTTKNSNYPRSELREMKDGGKSNAEWSSTSGTHTMYLDQAITAVPTVKKHVVAGQIHDDDDDVIVIRLEYPNLYVNVDGDNEYTLDSNYTLGKRFNIRFVVNDDKTKVYYNGGSEPVYSLDKSYNKAYFKAGAYTQSNCSKEGSDRCNDSNYGEVVIYSLNVSYQ